VSLDQEETTDIDAPDVLIVDDNPVNLELLHKMLEKRAYRVRLATSGRRALAAVGVAVPDLVMLDITMPQMDGYEVCRALKADPRTREVPVIFLSALDEVVDKVKAFDVGGADYVLKPFEFGEVLVRIENQLKIARLQRETARQNAELLRHNDELARALAELRDSQERETQMFGALTEVLPGTVLDGRYRLEEKIGAGGFGAVFRAKQIKLDRPVAVKVLQPRIRRRGPEEVRRFLSEGVSACRVNHPNAVAVFDSGTSESGIAYLVMELLQGRTLAEELAERQRLSFDRCLAVAIPLCQVLAEAHATSILHRDIKPENVFLHRTRDAEVVKLVDFGIAKLIGGGDEGAPSALAGTPHYMAPERLGHAGERSADVYSLGVMLYQMLGGTLPFPAHSFSDWVSMATGETTPPAPLASLNPEVPAGVADAIGRAMARNPTERPTARELEQILVRARADRDQLGAAGATPSSAAAASRDSSSSSA
jgi:eukaryotic-like serine/threonine-protein kinase